MRINYMCVCGHVSHQPVQVGGMALDVVHVLCWNGLKRF